MNIHTHRVKRVRDCFNRAGISAFLITKAENIFYLTGFRGDDSFLFITSHNKYIITDSRYRDELREAQTGCTLIIRAKNISLADVINSLIRKKRIRRVGFEPAHITYYQYRSLKKVLQGRKVKPCFRLVENLRMVKDASEVKIIKEAVRIAEGALYKMRRHCLSGTYTEKECADYLEYAMKKGGAEGPSFASIVALGRRSAFPHAVSGRKRIRRNNILLVDWGARTGGYCSDLTRTFFLGTITPRFKHLYCLVHDGQQVAFDSIKAGEAVRVIDKKVRAFFKKYKVDRYFTHALGHGIGLEVHESPSLINTAHEYLQENMIITVEPGLYIHTWGGIRIEDMVRVTKKGCERLSSFPHCFHK